MTEATVAYIILLMFLLKILFHYIAHIRSRNYKTNKRICTVPFLDCSHEESYVKLLDTLQTAIVLTAVLLLRPHNHLPLALHLTIFYAISYLLWPAVIDCCAGGNLAGGGILSRSAVTLNCYQVVARVLLAYWFGQHTFFTLVRIDTMYHFTV